MQGITFTLTNADARRLLRKYAPLSRLDNAEQYKITIEEISTCPYKQIIYAYARTLSPYKATWYITKKQLKHLFPLAHTVDHIVSSLIEARILQYAGTIWRITDEAVRHAHMEVLNVNNK